LDAVATPEEQTFWRLFFEKLLLAPKDRDGLLSLLKVLAQPHLQKFVAAMAAYLREDFDPAVSKSKTRDELLARSQLAQKSLAGMRRSI
jgi:hypothetical protein